MSNNIKKVAISFEIDEMLLEELYDEFGTVDTESIFEEMINDYLSKKHSQNQAMADHNAANAANSQNQFPANNYRQNNTNQRNNQNNQTNAYNPNNINNNDNAEHPIHAYQRRINMEEARKREAMRSGNIGALNPNRRRYNNTGNYSPNRRDNNNNNNGND